MKKLSITAAIAVTFLFGCAPNPKSGKGFTLPEGDAEAGQATFVDLQCNACHQVSGVDPIAADGATAPASVSLGGKVNRIQTYGELVTSIINPSHKLASGLARSEVSEDGESKMKNYNDVMTVQQLTDLVAFLQSKYELKQYEPTNYPMYGL